MRKFSGFLPKAATTLERPCMAAKIEHSGLPCRRHRPIISGGYRERPVHNKGVAFGGIQVRPAPVVNKTITSIQN
jgi:hypothetical protein